MFGVDRPSLTRFCMLSMSNRLVVSGSEPEPID